MENNNEVQEFDLDDILNEFHDAAAEDDLPEIEPDEELKELLGMPEPDIAPVVVKEPESVETMAQEAASEAGIDPVADEPTTVFTPAQEPAAGKAVPTGDTTSIPGAEEPTRTVPVQPAFEGEEEFIPPPILFAPRPRLKDLKKKLVAGPEKRYYELSGIGVGKLQIAILISVIIVALCAGITGMFALEMVPANRLRLVIFSQILAMLLSGLLGSHLMIDSIADLLKGRFTLNTLLTLTFAACIADGILCLKDLRIPCCAAFSLEMTFALIARCQKRTTEMSQMDTMRKATRLNGIIKVEEYFEGSPGLLRTEGQVEDFMDHYNKLSGPELLQCIYAGLSLVACIAIAVFAGLLHGMSMAVQILAISLLAAVPASFFVSVSRPAAILEKRLHMTGTVLCGWESVKDLCGKAAYPLQDEDLFPRGSTKLNGVKFYGSRSPDEVISCTTSLLKVSGSGLLPLFQQLLESRNGFTRPVDNFRDYGNGGVGGEIGGEPVLLGTLQFLQEMGIHIPEGTMVSQAVYAAIDGQLCAVYAISYAKMRSASAGLVALNGYRKITPVLLCSDFTVTEEFIRSKFGIKLRRMAVPAPEVKALLQKRQPDPEEPVLAITTRDELLSAAYAVSGARALRQATKLSVGIHLAGGILGLLIMLVLGYLGSTQLLTPINILLFQLVWAVPGLLFTEWTRVV